MHSRRPADPATLVLYEDPLSPWCLVAERRVAGALEDLSFAFRTLRIEPFPSRAEPRAVTRTDRRRLARVARRASREPEAAGTIPDLWLSPDPPISSLPVLTALLAARGQGCEATMRAALREAALRRGINVSRTDVLLELAWRAGLDMERFAGALAAAGTQARVLAVLAEAEEMGIREPPALVIGGEWLVAGPRSLDDYRAVLVRYASTRLGVPLERTLH